MSAGPIEPVRAISPREIPAVKVAKPPAVSRAIAVPETKPAAPSGALNPLRSLVLPLPQDTPRPALQPPALAAASPGLQSPYSSGLSKLTDVILLTREGISPEDLVEQAQVALRDHADAQDLSPSRFVEKSEIPDSVRLPSSNSADAAPAIRTSILAHGHELEATTLDLYVTRKGLTLWEAVAFNREDASRAGGFPYAAAPIAIADLRFDAARGQFASVVVGQMLQIWNPAPVSDGREFPIRRFVRLAISIAGMIASVAAWAADRPAAAAACVLASVAAFIFTWT